MQRKEVFWIIVLVVLGAVYARYFTHWGVKQPILIRASQRTRPNDRSGAPSMFFFLSSECKLTSVEVVPIKGEKFNPLERPAWHLISSSNSVPVRVIRYGQRIRGMQPAVTNVAADPLIPGTAYRLLVNAGSSAGSFDFVMKAPQ